METISIMSKSGQIIKFNYFDSNDYVYKKLCTTMDSGAAIAFLNYFEKKKKEMYNKAYIEYLKKAREDFKLSIIDTLIFDNMKIYLTVFDTENDIYFKYSKMLKRNLTDEEKMMVYNRFKQNLEQCINNSMYEKGKIK